MISKTREFQGLPVREGRGDILVQPTKLDIKNAIRHDPENCAYARCLRRMLETSRVFVYTTVCYVETLDETGQPIMERYIVKNHAHAYIQRFDAGEEVGPGGFILHRPNRHQTLEYKRQAQQKYYKANPEKPMQYYRASAARKKANPKRLTGTFRDGTGMVHFVGKEGILTVRKEQPK